MILTFRSPDAQQLFVEGRNRNIPADIQRVAVRKLLALNAATELAQLMVPPGNRLEKLSGDRDGQYSIRVNDQWRICFKWTDGNAEEVEIVDYH